jgi:hypothetical protein
MPSFIIVEKTGSVKCTTSKTLNVAELYKKCGFKTNDGFTCAHTWSITFNEVEYKLQIYGKITGRAGTENKYEFPPPIDSVLFFGSCAVINTQDGEIVDMSATEFKDIMDYLQGGYSDLGDEDTEDDAESDSDDAKEKTKQGYVKDDFVVEDDDVDDDDESESSVEEPVAKKSKGKTAKASAKQYLESINVNIAGNISNVKPTIIKKVPAKPKPKPAPIPRNMPVQEILECSEELMEEEYV